LFSWAQRPRPGRRHGKQKLPIGLVAHLDDLRMSNGHFQLHRQAPDPAPTLYEQTPQQARPTLWKTPSALPAAAQFERTQQGARIARNPQSLAGRDGLFSKLPMTSMLSGS
jgi:hypothetical protein